jgi:hypothetical protein
MSFNRVAAVGGFIAIVLIVLSVALTGSQPTLDDPIEDVMEYLNNDADMHRASLVFSVLDLPFFALFLAGVASKLRDSDREHGEAWAIVAIAGGILIGAAAGTGEVLMGALFLRGGDGLDASVVRVLFDGAVIAYVSAGVAIAALTGSVAASAIRHRFWPEWYGWLSALVAAVGFASVAGVVWTSTTGFAVGAIALPTLAIWTLTTSVLMYRDGSGTSD